MNGRDLLEAMSFLEEELVDLSERRPLRLPWKKWAAMAACLALILFAVRPYFLPKGATESISDQEAIAQTNAALFENSITGSGNTGTEAVPEDAPAAEAPAAAAGDQADGSPMEQDTDAFHVCAVVAPQAPGENEYTAVVLDVLCQDHPIAAGDQIILIPIDGCEAADWTREWSVTIEQFDPATNTALVSRIIAE